ncbi:MAG: hypothetical protein IT370_25270 [Deltaproteobacteria bacterium]|nr:hypothetical protein [Deltaproteobacteria bacterium]
MSGLAAVVWPAGAPPRQRMHALATVLIDAMAHRATEGRVLDDVPGIGVLAFARHAATTRERDPLAATGWVGGVQVVAHARLEEREALLAALGLGADSSDAALLAAGLARWGEALLPRLEGSFAFVAWDARTRTLWAARDALGTRPLWFARSGELIALASEEAALAALPGVGAELDARALLAFLGDGGRDASVGYRAGITRVLPGHLLRADAAGERQSRWFVPPAEAPERDPVGATRAMLQRVVGSALESDLPLVLQLSGGIDSATIAGLAAQHYGVGAARGLGSPLTLASAVYPGRGCDETPFIDAIVAHVGLPARRWDADALARFETAPVAGEPYQFIQNGIPTGVHDTCRLTGARSVLTGTGGDQLFFERGVFRDLALAHRPLQLLSSALRVRYSMRGPGFYLTDAARALAPDFARRWVRGWREPPVAPGWLGPALRAVFPSGAMPSPAPEPAVASQTQRYTWASLTAPGLVWSIDTQELAGARAGVELRHPLLDARLVRQVLALPVEARLPRSRFKQLLRDAAGDALPPAVAMRDTPTVFSASVRAIVRTSWPALLGVLTTGPWLSEPWVDRRGACALADQLWRRGLPVPPLRPITTLWNIASLESWLRQGIHCVHLPTSLHCRPSGQPARTLESRGKS